MVSKIIVFLLIIAALVVITMLNKSNKKVKKANNRKTKGEANKIKNEKNTKVKDVAIVEEKTSSKKKEVEIDPEGLKARAVRGSEETKSIKRGRARRK